MTIDKNKVFTVDSQFTKELPTADEAIDSIFISGYASVNSPDRVGDIIPSSAWEAGMENYLKNPIILAYHDHDDPIGRMVEHKTDSKGLWIKARISAAAEVFNLIKDGVITAFSVSFRVKDAVYDAVTELFVIKELELIEISVVSVPCHQDTLFSLSKSFSSDEEYKSFKTQFVKGNETAKGLSSSTSAKSITSKEIGMDPKELQEMLEAAAKRAAEATAKSIADAQKAAEAEAAKKAAEEAELQMRINKALEAVTPSTTGAEKLLAEIQKRAEEQEKTAKSLIEGLEAAVKEKTAELEAIQKSKMTFREGGKAGEVPYEEKEKAVLLSKISRKSVEDTKFGRELIVKYAGTAQPGTHLASATWELEVSNNMEAEVRRRLVMAPLLRSVNMSTNVMTFPLNPEAGDAQWMANTAWGTTTSAGNTVVHALKEVTLNAYKVATNEYVAYEEEEDSLVVLLPVIRDAMIRRVSRSIDKAYLLGAGSGADPVKGISTYDPTSAVNVTNTSKVTVANLASLRRDMGVWGLEPRDMVYVVSSDVYFDLLDDTTFQTMDKVGAAATILTGQVGQVNGSPVIVSAMFPTKAGSSSSGTTNLAALAFAPGNFLAGNQRGLRFDTQDLVETQRRVLVASLRTGLTQLTTNLGAGCSVLRWS